MKKLFLLSVLLPFSVITICNDNVFKITSWNVEWLSCTSPTLNNKNRELQVNNVVEAIKFLNSDVVALQEVGTSSTYATIDTLVKRLGSEWGGNIVYWSNSNCDQNLAIIYKKSTVQLVKSALLNSGDTHNASYPYTYCWSGNKAGANGRYPAVYDVNLLTGDNPIPVSFINIHAKAMGDTENYTRRQFASLALKEILDGPLYNTKAVMLFGDFNDYLEGTTCGDCDGLSGLSPYKNFMDDTGNYMGLTQNLQDQACRTYPRTIDNMIISDELFDCYIAGSAMQEQILRQVIPSYCNTTSDHLPVSITLRFSTSTDYQQPSAPSTKTYYPNPATDIVNLGSKSSVKVYSPQGKLLQSITDSQVDLSAYPQGIYLLLVDGETVKIVKE